MRASDEGLVLPAEAQEAIVNHAVWCHPLEACGLLALVGRRTVAMVYPLTNADASPARFTIAPREHFGAVNHAERQGWEIGGAFHSHPDGGATPSPVDLAAAQGEGWIDVVVGFVPGLELRAWMNAVEVPVLTPV